MIVNKKPYTMNLSSNLFLSNIQKICPIVVSLTPCLCDHKGNLLPLTKIHNLMDEYGIDFLTENFIPFVAFSMFKSSERLLMDNIFRDEELAEDFVADAFDELLNLVSDDHRENIKLIQNIFIEVRDEKSLNEFIEYTYDTIDSVFKNFNENIEGVDKWFKDNYERIGSFMNLNYVFDHIETPDKILDFGGKTCGVFKSRLATTYLLPNGL